MRMKKKDREFNLKRSEAEVGIYTAAESKNKAA